MNTFRSVGWYWLLAWTMGLWIAAFSLVAGELFATAAYEVLDYWTASIAAGISALLAAIGTIRLILWPKPS